MKSNLICSLSVFFLLTGLSAAEKSVDCINFEKVEFNGVKDIYSLKPLTDQEVRNRFLTLTYNDNFNDVFDDITTDGKMDGTFTLIETIPPKKAQVYTTYRYKYHFTAIKNHKPQNLRSQSGLLSQEIKGEHRPDGMFFTDTAYVGDLEKAKAELLQNVTRRCQDVNGVLENTTFHSSRPVEISIRTFCKGDFYFYNDISNIVIEANDCDKDIEIDGIKGSQYCSIIMDEAEAKFSSFSTKPVQTINYKKYVAFYVSENDKKLTDQWRCMRIASCQAKQDKTVDEEVIKSYEESCKMAQSKIFDPKNIFTSSPTEQKDNTINDSKLHKKLSLPDEVPVKQTGNTIEK